MRHEGAHPFVRVIKGQKREVIKGREGHISAIRAGDLPGACLQNQGSKSNDGVFDFRVGEDRDNWGEELRAD